MRGKDQKNGFTAKPATKLYNAWFAGVPAILPNEYAYRQLRKSELDYIEIKQPEDAANAILKLKNNPDLYRAMVENGLKRSNEFAREKIVAQWVDLLQRKIPEQASSARFRDSKRIPLPIRIFLRRMKRYAEGRSKR